MFDPETIEIVLKNSAETRLIFLTAQRRFFIDFQTLKQLQNPSKIMPSTRKPNHAGQEGSEKADRALKPSQN